MMYQGQTEKPQLTCGYCGRVRGGGFNFTCHLCGATYCYAHKPDRCDHQRPKITPVTPLPPKKT